MITERKIAYDLLTALQFYAPDSDAQAIVTVVYNRTFEINGESYTVLIKTLANILSDGLTYGNWPWLTFANKGQENVGPESPDWLMGE